LAGSSATSSANIIRLSLDLICQNRRIPKDSLWVSRDPGRAHLGLLERSAATDAAGCATSAFHKPRL